MQFSYPMKFFLQPCFPPTRDAQRNRNGKENVHSDKGETSKPDFGRPAEMWKSIHGWRHPIGNERDMCFT